MHDIIASCAKKEKLIILGYFDGFTNHWPHCDISLVHESDSIKTKKELNCKTAKYELQNSRYIKASKHIRYMPKFLDVHSLKGFDEETLKKLQQSPVDEFGITHLNIMHSKEEDRFFCLLDAPNKEAVENHHNKAGVKCEWITEVKTTA